MAFEAGDLNQAQRYYSEALDFFRRSGSDRELLDCLNNLGEINYLRGQFGEARNYWKECSNICSQTGYAQGMIEPLTTWAPAHRLELLQEGKQYLDRAWKIAEETQALKEQA